MQTHTWVRTCKHTPRFVVDLHSLIFVFAFVSINNSCAKNINNSCAKYSYMEIFRVIWPQTFLSGVLQKCNKELLNTCLNRHVLLFIIIIVPLLFLDTLPAHSYIFFIFYQKTLLWWLRKHLFFFFVCITVNVALSSIQHTKAVFCQSRKSDSDQVISCCEVHFSTVLFLTSTVIPKCFSLLFCNCDNCLYHLLLF